MNKKAEVPLGLILLLACIFRVASEPTANISFVLLAAYGFGGRVKAVQALALTWLFSMLNPGLVPDASQAAMGRYMVIISVAASVVLRGLTSKPVVPDRKAFTVTVLLGLFLVIHALMFSVVVGVSVLKISSWLLVVLTLLSAWSGMSPSQHAQVFSQLRFLLCLLITMSLPLCVIPSIGYLRNGTGFQGFLNHPQAFGPTAAFAAILVMGRLISDHHPRWRDILLFLLLIAEVVMSAARTAALALMIGLFITIAVYPFVVNRTRRQAMPGLFNRRLATTSMLALLAVLAAAPLMIGQVTSYLTKGSGTTNLVDAADASRGMLVLRMIANIQERPWTGIGFGIASDPSDMEGQRDPLFDLPLSAPIEKGVMPIAVLEELGVVGALAVLFWMKAILRRGAQSGPAQFAIILTLLLSNLGESTLFSVGGMGMLILILVTWAVTGPRNNVVPLNHV